MLQNLKQVTVALPFEFPQYILHVHVFIHLPWERTRSMLDTTLNDVEVGTFWMVAAELAFKAFKCRNFALIKNIFSAVYPDYLEALIENFVYFASIG